MPKPLSSETAWFYVNGLVSSTLLQTQYHSAVFAVFWSLPDLPGKTEDLG